MNKIQLINKFGIYLIFFYVKIVKYKHLGKNNKI